VLFACSEDPPWRQLIKSTLNAHERILLITAIFSDNNQIKAVSKLSGDDAQAFIDVIDEVSLHAIPCSKGRSFKSPHVIN